MPDTLDEVKKKDTKAKRHAGHGKCRIGTQLDIGDQGIFSLFYISNFKRCYIKAAILNTKPQPVDEKKPAEKSTKDEDEDKDKDKDKNKDKDKKRETVTDDM